MATSEFGKRSRLQIYCGIVEQQFGKQSPMYEAAEKALKEMEANKGKAVEDKHKAALMEYRDRCIEDAMITNSNIQNLRELISADPSRATELGEKEQHMMTLHSEIKRYNDIIDLSNEKAAAKEPSFRETLRDRLVEAIKQNMKEFDELLAKCERSPDLTNKENLLKNVEQRNVLLSELGRAEHKLMHEKVYTDKVYGELKNDNKMIHEGLVKEGILDSAGTDHDISDAIAKNDKLMQSISEWRTSVSGSPKNDTPRKHADPRIRLSGKVKENKDNTPKKKKDDHER